MSQLVEPNAIEEKRLVQLVVSKGRKLSYKNIYVHRTRGLCITTIFKLDRFAGLVLK